MSLAVTNKVKILKMKKTPAQRATKRKLVLAILCIWLPYAAGCIITYEIKSGLLLFIMGIISITMLPLMLTGAAMDTFKVKNT